MGDFAHMFRMLVVVATLLLSLTVEGVPVSPTLPHYKLESWPVVPKGQSLGPVGCSAVCDVSQQVFVAQRGAAMDPVVVFSANGTMVGSWGKEHLQTPHGIRIRRSGGCEEIWVTDVALHVARRFNSAGELTATLGIPGINGSGTHPVQFSEPTDVAFTSQEMFIADGDAGINNRILVFDADRLHLIRVIGEKGSGPGQFFVPHSISVDALDRLWVADRNNARLQVLTPQGHYIGEWNCGWDISEPDNGQPFGIWHVGEVFAITDGKANHTLVVRPPPMTHDDIGSCHVEQILPHENGVAHLPAGDVQGNLYISEVGPAPLGAKVLKYDREA